VDILELEGIFIPNVTPFNSSGEIDKGALLNLVDYWLGTGVSGLVVNASTGEAPYLSRNERNMLLKLVLDKVGEGAKVIAGTGAASTMETIELTRDAEDLGANAALVVTPFFYRPSDEEIFQHFTTLLATVEVPVILYNVPKFTGYSINPWIIERIASECSNLIGVKDSSGSPGAMAETIRLVGDGINVLSGSADMVLPTLSLGGKGGIIAVANVIPETCVGLYSAYNRGDLKEAGRLQLRTSFANKVLVREHSQIAAIKAALNLMGRPAGYPRRPLRPLPQAEEQEVREALKLMKLL
jgi:4-hydroxy-tetrahydrodipicolinate synthase